MARSIVIVASTLPIAFIAANFEALRVSRIVTMSENLSRSYCYLSRRSAREIVIETAPSGLVRQSLYFAWLMVRCRIYGDRLVFFHECCMPIFDLLTHALRPKGDHFPQVSMLGSIPMELSAAPKSKLFTLLRMSGLSRFFTLYYSPQVGKNSGEYSLSVNVYPASIVSHSVGYAGSEQFRNHGASELTPAVPAILFLTGKTFSHDEDQIKVFRSLETVAARKGFRCDIKDHPNPYFRLGYVSGLANVIDPTMPSELLDDDYRLVIGASSTGLLAYGSRAYSILDILPSSSPERVALAKRHFDMTAPGHSLRFLTTIDQFEAILEELKA